MPDTPPAPTTPDPAALQRELDSARQTIAALERRQHIDALLAGEQVVDLEAARLLTEQAVSQMSEPDVALAVRDLRKHRPYLFARPASDAQQAVGLMPPREEPGSDLQAAADAAAASGHRSQLLAYLRLRRTR